MADYNIGGSEGYENGQLVYGDYDYSFDDLHLNNFTDQETTDPEQNLQQEFDLPAGTNEFFPSLSTNQGRQAASGAQLCQQQQFRQPLGTNEFLPGFLPKSTVNQGCPAASGTEPWPHQQLGQPAGPNGCLPEPWINQGQGNHAAAATQSLIPRQHSGQSPVIVTGDPHSQRNIVKNRAPDFLVKKRGYDKTYREKGKKRKQDLEDENGRLKLEIEEKEQQIMKSKLEASEAENGRLKSKLEECEAKNERLKHEIQVKEKQMKFNLETEFKRLRDEVDSLKGDNAWVNQRMQTQSTELAQLRNKFDKFKLKQQNQRTKKKRRISSSEEFGVQIQENDSVDSAKNIPIISAAKEAKQRHMFLTKLMAGINSSMNQQRWHWQGQRLQRQRVQWHNQWLERQNQLLEQRMQQLRQQLEQRVLQGQQELPLLQQLLQQLQQQQPLQAAAPAPPSQVGSPSTMGIPQLYQQSQQPQQQPINELKNSYEPTTDECVIHVLSTGNPEPCPASPQVSSQTLGSIGSITNSSVGLGVNKSNSVSNA